MSDQLTSVMQALSQVQGNTAGALSNTMQAKNDRRRLELQEKQQKADNIFRGIETGVNTVGMGMNLWGDYKGREELERSNRANEGIAEEQNDLTRREQDLRDEQFYTKLAQDDELTRWTQTEQGEQALEQLQLQGDLSAAEQIRELNTQMRMQQLGFEHERGMQEDEHSFRLDEIDAMSEARRDEISHQLGLEREHLDELRQMYPGLNLSIGSASASHPADYGGVGTSAKDRLDNQLTAIEQYKQDINLHEVVNEMGEVDPSLVRDYITDLYRQTGDTPPANLEGMGDDQLLSEMWTMINESPRAALRRDELYKSMLTESTTREAWEGLATGLNAYSLREGVEAPETEGMTSSYLSFLDERAGDDEWLRNLGETAFNVLGQDEDAAREMVVSVDDATDALSDLQARRVEEGDDEAIQFSDRKTFRDNWVEMRTAIESGLIGPSLAQQWEEFEADIAEKWPSFYSRQTGSQGPARDRGIRAEPGRGQSEAAEEDTGAAGTYTPYFNIPY